MHMTKWAGGASVFGLLALAVASPVQAASMEPLALATCMKNHTTQADEDGFRHMLIAALQEDQDGVRTSFSNFLSSLMRIGLECGMTVDDFGQPWAEAGVNLYAVEAGRSIMARAMTKSGLTAE
jgi:hypothetical protein